MVLCVTSLTIRLWPPFGAVLGEEGGVKEPTLCTPRLPPTDFYRKKGIETILKTVKTEGYLLENLISDIPNETFCRKEGAL